MPPHHGLLRVKNWRGTVRGIPTALESDGLMKAFVSRAGGAIARELGLDDGSDE